MCLCYAELPLARGSKQVRSVRSWKVASSARMRKSRIRLSPPRNLPAPAVSGYMGTQTVREASGWSDSTMLSTGVVAKFSTGEDYSAAPSMPGGPAPRGVHMELEGNRLDAETLRFSSYPPKLTAGKAHRPMPTDTLLWDNRLSHGPEKR